MKKRYVYASKGGSSARQKVFQTERGGEKMTKEQIYDFFARFDGPDGCSTRSICLLMSLSPQMKKGEGVLTWQCPGDQSKTLSRSILRSMGIPEKEQAYFLSFLETYEGSCE
jgi:hypothetical protein